MCHDRPWTVANCTQKLFILVDSGHPSIPFRTSPQKRKLKKRAVCRVFGGSRNKEPRYNYTRFFLRYVNPRIPEIQAGSFAFLSLALLPGWETMMGLQFENLVLNNLPEVLRALGL